MAPVLDPETYHFAGGCDPALMSDAMAAFHEDEGLSLIVTDAMAKAHDLPRDLPMARITLSVHSALEGVGLTSAVAQALAQGKTHKMVAGDLGTSPSTVRNQTQSIYSKLEIGNRADLAKLISGVI